MRKHVGLAILLASIVLTPSLARARGYGGSTGTVMGPYGPLYNTGSPEWKASGGNVILYEQIMEQKMMMQQQQMWVKQQQMWAKQQQQQAKKGPTANNGGGFYTPTASQPVPRKKKKRRTYDPTHPVTSSAAAKADATKGASPTKAATTVSAAKPTTATP